ncbi:nucleotidyltransferase [Bacillus massiliigorillae]|uniref:nucleotidyltransferase n=1 Tax=Bacillus massiliigorillae TaxID=1243664 RepID=UPI000399E7F2|nr:nucleotidyltransferase [Bacillus massiliigorillae]
MKAVGLIVEYNPFHNGHHYHVKTSKLQNDADVVIAVMSGSFLQRGEPALVSKWNRAAMALQGGVDLVIELPYIYSTQHAEHFAAGAVSLLEALRCDTFCFGSENGSIEAFLSKHKQMTEHTEEINESVRGFIKEGNNYPKAISLALEHLGLQQDGDLDLTKPNNILGYQYVRAALESNYRIQPTLINRIAAGYHDTQLPTGTIASATSIRKALLDSDQETNTTESFMPAYTYHDLKNYIQTFEILHQWEHYWSLLQYKLISSTVEELEKIYEVEEGIQHRMKEAALVSNTFAEFIMKVKTKRYTMTRLQRICVHILTHTKKEKMKRCLEEPAYLRILGFTENGRKYLNEKKKSVELPLISKIANVQHEALTFDIQASIIHSLALPQNKQKKMIQREYQQPIIV